jgi:MFS family permease
VSGDRVDIFGSLVVFLSLGSLIFAFSESSVIGWNNWAVVLSIILFIIFIPIFILIERHTDSPIFDFALFRNRAYAMANLSTFLSFFSQTATVLLISLYYQVTQNNTPFQAGLKILPIIIGMLIFSPISSSLINKYSVQKLSSSGLALTGAGLLILSLCLGSDVPYWFIAIALCLVGIGFGIFLPPNTTTIMTLVPAHRRGAANGIRSMLNNMGQLLSTSVSLMIVIALLPAQLKNIVLSATTLVLSRTDFQLVTTSFRWGLFSLFVASILGTLASLLRGSLKNN